MKTEPAYIVIDTKVLVSAGLFPPSKTAQVIALAVEHVEIAQNQNTWHELETRISRPKFDRYVGESGRLQHLVAIARSVQFFEVKNSVAVGRDQTDDTSMGLALDSGAKLLISGDRVWRGLRSFSGADILWPTQFFERFNTL